jgi:riboflavin synthase
MFTGIVEGIGRVARLEFQGQIRKLTLELPAGLTGFSLGDSINVNGACLTVVQMRNQTVELDLSSETLQRTALSEIREGYRVNLERALRLTDRLGGHIVTGHIDGIGEITEKREEGNFVRLRIRLPGSASRYVVQKGSIAIDGVSLTVNLCQGEEIEMTLIPHTLQKTTLLDKRIGERVNVETDILGKYVEKLLDHGGGRTGGLDRTFLGEHGFAGRE